MWNKVQKIILNVFLILGIFFFSIIIYSLISEGVIFNKKENIKSVRLIEIRVLKNLFLDSNLVDSISTLERMESYQTLHLDNDNFFLLKCNEDSLNYARSNNFNLKSLTTPETIDFYKNPKIPISKINKQFSLGIYNYNNNLIVDFPKINLEHELRTYTNIGDLSEQKEIILESLDKKISLFLIVEINVLVSPN